jgi:hypothetical protein
MSKFDAALIILQGIVDCPGTQRLTIYEDFKADKLDEFKAAISVLEAAGKVDKAKSIIARLRAADETEKLYYELLYEVARAFPDETRHETARRYIRQAEVMAHEQAKAIADYEEVKR